ncbi:MAG: carboxymethylenebutenolidase [Gammaproteobacteria bacterium]|jgi:carboxymethylenebutenolidase
MNGRTITLRADDGGEFSAYIVAPNGRSAPGIVLLHEIFGLTDWNKEIADTFAAAGYCVAAPEMFSRLERNFFAGLNDPEQTEKGLRFRGLVDHGLAMNDIESVIADLNTMAQCNGKFGVVGFFFGGTLAYLTAARLNVDAAVAYYGTQIHEFLDEAGAVTCPTLLHMGTADDHIPEPLREQIRVASATNPAIAIHLYDAGHAFANSARTAYYSERTSRIAHARTFELFDALRSPSLS